MLISEFKKHLEGIPDNYEIAWGVESEQNPQDILNMTFVSVEGDTGTAYILFNSPDIQ